ncbi:MAG: RIP metalloprotease RseP [Ignavibacteria bacterium]|nr:RIP metalloprotease RseP [Ignavibacteria bacterium]
MDYIIYFALTIGILVFIHEFGHFAAAKLSGMRVDVFAIGFGKRLLGWNKKTGFKIGELPKDFDGEGNTDYRLSLLPLGGYVKIAGMIDESFDTEFAKKEPQPYEFRSKGFWKKSFVITAGVFMNLLLALLVFWGANFFKGKPVTETTTLGYVTKDSPAYSAGFFAGDKILKINNEPVNNWEALTTEMYVNTLGEDLSMMIERNGETISIPLARKDIPDFETEGEFFIRDNLKPAVIDVLADSPAKESGILPGDIFLSINNVSLSSSKQLTKVVSSNIGNQLPLVVLRDKDTVNIAVTPGSDGMIGISIGEIYMGEVYYQTYGFFESFYYAGGDIVNITSLTFSVGKKVFAGDIEFGKAFGGPVRIAQLAAKSADVGIESFLYFLAILSLSLALINIMPFPVLDGGHLLVIILETVFRREIPVKIKIAIQNTGLILLLLLMAFIIYNDILSL